MYRDELQEKIWKEHGRMPNVHERMEYEKQQREKQQAEVLRERRRTEAMLTDVHPTEQPPAGSSYQEIREWMRKHGVHFP